MLNTYDAIKLQVELFDRNRKIVCLTLDKCDLEKEIDRLTNEIDTYEWKLNKQKSVSVFFIFYSIIATVALYIAV